MNCANHRMLTAPEEKTIILRDDVMRIMAAEGIDVWRFINADVQACLSCKAVRLSSGDGEIERVVPESQAWEGWW